MTIVINGTSGITDVDGTAAAPALTGTDTDTGIFFPAANTIAWSTGGTERMRVDSSGNLQFNSGYGSTATAYGCRAWVNFNGTGTVAIRASGNVSSITDNGTGYYTVNFTTAMPDANYSAPMNCSNGSYYANIAEPLSQASGSVTIYCWSRGTSSTGASAAYDMTTVQVAVLR